ncbi:hypothetical protein DPMN_140748 [Dreissena polymorpha]|uniref:Uncharacterized protein n=1 Tax=Dreissena polymorpha TaxID=45954 RepID=A0A9D4G869_DREPO|nr:hypothetical protein DPMN_140748 [Dreissena polymorpha]
MCGASVAVTIVAESGKLKTFSYPPLTTRSVKIRFEECGLAPPGYQHRHLHPTAQRNSRKKLK